jgi:hypothetical protein
MAITLSTIYALSISIHSQLSKLESQVILHINGLDVCCKHIVIINDNCKRQFVARTHYGSN